MDRWSFDESAFTDPGTFCAAKLIPKYSHTWPTKEFTIVHVNWQWRNID